MERRSVRLSGGVVSYLTAGRGERGSVVLLHGGGADSAELSWGGVIPRLAEAGYGVCAPDHPGYGHSDRPASPQGQSELLTYLAELIETLDLTDAVLGGLSMGGGMALGHALEHRVRGLMLLGSYGLMPAMGGRLTHLASWLWVHSGAGPRVSRAMGRSPRLVEASLGSLVRDRSVLPADFGAEIRAALGGPGPATFEQWQRSEIGCSGLRTDYRERVGDLDCPVLFVHGAADPGVTLRWVRQAAAVVDDAELVVVPGGKHWVQRDAPEQTVQAMLSFLERVCPGR